jgi:ABC-type Na+ efflux pump permease subunit
MDDERFYEAVAEEISNGIYKQGIRTKAFAEADGVESKAQALYIKYRVAQLIEQASLEKKARELEAAEQRKRDIAEKQAKEAADAASEGIVPVHVIVFVLIVVFLVSFASALIKH